MSIQFDHVQLAYPGPQGRPIPVLQDISLEIAKGEIVVLIGASGCGKTSLLRCINGLNSITAGQLKVAGFDLSRPLANPEALRTRVGMVFQQFNLFPHLTVLQNITLAPIHVRKKPPKDAIAQAMALLDPVAMTDKAHDYPDQLSGGQQQRVAILRSLAMDPDILLLDEPTSALDPDMTWEVLELIQRVADRGMTMVIVTHEIAFARRAAHRILFMREGRIEESGPPDVLLGNPQHASTRDYLKRLLAYQV